MGRHRGHRTNTLVIILCSQYSYWLSCRTAIPHMPRGRCPARRCPRTPSAPHPTPRRHAHARRRPPTDRRTALRPAGSFRVDRSRSRYRSRTGCTPGPERRGTPDRPGCRRLGRDLHQRKCQGRAPLCGVGHTRRQQQTGVSSAVPSPDRAPCGGRCAARPAHRQTAGGQWGEGAADRGGCEGSGAARYRQHRAPGGRFRHWRTAAVALRPGERPRRGPQAGREPGSGGGSERESGRGGTRTPVCRLRKGRCSSGVRSGAHRATGGPERQGVCFRPHHRRGPGGRYRPPRAACRCGERREHQRSHRRRLGQRAR